MNKFRKLGFIEYGGKGALKVHSSLLSVVSTTVEWARITGSAATPAATSSPVPTIRAGLATEGEARARLEVHGYSAITVLVKNGDGVWRGTAMRSGKRVAVGVDPRGDVGLTGPRD